MKLQVGDKVKVNLTNQGKALFHSYVSNPYMSESCKYKQTLQDALNGEDLVGEVTEANGDTDDLSIKFCCKHSQTDFWLIDGLKNPNFVECTVLNRKGQ
jgi:hypothetical protein